jgi:putative endonuclease
LKKKGPARGWSVYILECGGGRLYTGMTNDIERRLRAHRTGKGARFTRSFGVRKLLYTEKAGGRADALRREALIKSWTRKKKLALIKGKRKPKHTASRREA